MPIRISELRYNSCHAIKLILPRRPPRTSLELRKSTPLESHRFSTVCGIKTCKKFAEGTPSARSGCGAAGSALPWGGRGRKFKSCHSDQEEIRKNLLFSFIFSRFLAFSCVQSVNCNLYSCEKSPKFKA